MDDMADQWVASEIASISFETPPKTIQIKPPTRLYGERNGKSQQYSTDRIEETRERLMENRSITVLPQKNLLKRSPENNTSETTSAVLPGNPPNFKLAKDRTDIVLEK